MGRRLVFAAVVVVVVALALLWAPCPKAAPTGDPTVITTHYLPPER